MSGLNSKRRFSRTRVSATIKYQYTERKGTLTPHVISPLLCLWCHSQAKIKVQKGFHNTDVHPHRQSFSRRKKPSLRCYIPRSSFGRSYTFSREIRSPGCPVLLCRATVFDAGVDIFALYLTYDRWASTLPSCLWSPRIFPALPGSRLTNYYRDASLELLQLVNRWLNFYLLTFVSFPLRTPEQKSWCGKNRTHDFRTSTCARLPTINRPLGRRGTYLVSEP